MYYDAIFLSSINYVLPQCFFSSADLRSIGSKAQQAFAVKCGFSRTISLAVRYGPHDLGGAGFLTLETLQGEGQILNVLKHLRSQSHINAVLQSTLAWAQLVAGVHQPILEYPSIRLPHLEGRLFPSMRKFLHTIDGSISLANSFVPATQRQNDRYLMNMAMSYGRFSDAQIRLINFCRLHLQVVTLSDVVIADGQTLDPAMLVGHVSLLSSSTTWLHVNQRTPDKRTWKVWKAFMHMLSCYLDDHPLGPWLHSPASLRRSWPAYFDPSSKQVFLRSTDGFLRCYKRSTTCYSIGWRRVPIPPASAFPTTVTIHDNDVLELHQPCCQSPRVLKTDEDRLSSTCL